jgi:hypothetical protein
MNRDYMLAKMDHSALIENSTHETIVAMCKELAPQASMEELQKYIEIISQKIYYTPADCLRHVLKQYAVAKRIVEAEQSKWIRGNK